jgi:hypothetical protein
MREKEKYWSFGHWSIAAHSKRYIKLSHYIFMSLFAELFTKRPAYSQVAACAPNKMDSVSHPDVSAGCSFCCLSLSAARS